VRALQQPRFRSPPLRSTDRAALQTVLRASPPRDASVDDMHLRPEIAAAECTSMPARSIAAPSHSDVTSAGVRMMRCDIARR
jgi:hypothetical protein